MRRLVPFLLASLTPALAEEEPALPRGVRIEVQEDALDPADRTDEWRPRIELSVQLLGRAPGAKTKQGPAAFAHTIHLDKDLRFPRLPALGWRGLIELQTPLRIAVGLSYGRAELAGPRRQVHYRGATLGTTFHPGGTAVATRLELQRAVVHVRVVILDDDRLHVSVGTGAAWASFRIGTSAWQLGHESRRVEAAFAPTLGYRVAWRPARRIELFLESSLGLVAPSELAATLSETRVGVAWHPLDQVALTTGVEVFSADLEDQRERWDGRTTRGHRFEQASWTTIGLDVGLVARF